MTDLKKYQFNLPSSGVPATGGFTGWGRAAAAAPVPAAAPPARPSAMGDNEALPADAGQCVARGNAWLQDGRAEDAIRAYDRAIALDPNALEPHFNRGNALLRLQRQPEALAAFERSIALAPELAIAHYNRATLLGAAGRGAEAAQGYERALALDPALMQARFNLGAWHQEQGRLDQALECMDQVIAQAPNVAQAHLGRGTALLKMKRVAEAVQSFDRALALQPRYPEALSNRGSARLQLQQHEAAMADLKAALSLNPRQAQSLHLMGGLLDELQRPEDALASFQLAYDTAPDMPGALTDLLRAMTAVCDWRWLDEGVKALAAAVEQGAKGVDPVTVLGLLDSPKLQLACARQFLADGYSAKSPLAPFGHRTASRKVRVGYYAAGFQGHASAHLLAELFERHDRSQFEWFAFSYGPGTHDAMRARLAKAFDQFLDVSGSTDREVVELSRQLGMDIAVDLSGLTKEGRPGIFAQRCAPVQVSYLGYPATTGSEHMDYVIGDKVVLPASIHPCFSENVVTLPHCYQVSDAQRRVADRVFTREEAGLPEQGFVFCCFGGNDQIRPATFAGWMRVLQAVPGSVLWLLEGNAAAARHLRAQAQARGVDPARLVFAPRLPLDQHLARQPLADLFLDTLPVNAHTAVSDALWVGLPVLTLCGQAFAARVGASLLNAVGLPELVATTQAAYELRAQELAHDAARLRGLRERLHAQRTTSPLFNARLFARHIEAAYLLMDERKLQGLPPKPFEIRA